MTSALAMLFLWEALSERQSLSLIEQMGDERFHAREAASAALVRLVRADDGHALLPRLHAATRHADPEVARRAECVVAEFYNLRPSRAPLVPWIDMLPAAVKDREALIREYCRRGHEAGCPANAPRWYNYRFATSLYVGDLLRAGTTRSKVQKLLDEMADAERQYKAKNNLPEDY